MNNEELRAAQRERILAAAEGLLVTHGVEKTRLRDVSEAAGVSIGTVQHYFDTRDRLIAELFDWSSERRLAGWLAGLPAGGDPWSRLVGLLGSSLPEPLLARSRVWIEFIAMARDDELRPSLDRFYEAWRPPFREAIEDGVTAGVFHPTMPVDDIVDLFIIVVDGAQIGIALGAPGIDRGQLQRLLLRTARATLRPDPGLVEDALDAIENVPALVCPQRRHRTPPGGAA